MIARLFRAIAWRRRCQQLDAALAERRATRAAYRQAQVANRAAREAERLRQCRARFNGETA